MIRSSEHEMTVASLSAADVSRFATQFNPSTHSERQMARRWSQQGWVRRSINRGRCYFGIPAAHPAVVYAYDSGAFELRQRPTLCWLGDIRTVPVHILRPSDRPFRVVIAEDREEQIAHLNPRCVHQHLQRFVTERPNWPSGVLLAQPAAVAELWRRFVTETYAKAGVPQGLAAFAAFQQLSDPAMFWFASGTVAVARSFRDDNAMLCGGCYVPDEHGREGYHALMLQARIAHAYSVGLRRVVAGVAEDNEEGFARLRERGFKPYVETWEIV